MSLPPRPDDDPRPQPPACPDNDDCCHSGCDPCIFDLYDEEFGRYRAALAAWEAREAERAAQAKASRKPAAKSTESRGKPSH
ncbi:MULTISPECIES: oxidoreductase-like domain-containing protein [unclassified Paraburkholderia]|uniref:oxidoreductase-like domain-containing protein n=1 Tax=unclassified Paraburkholderia TaxID=2615204 RepID=UPI002AB6B5F3|nr:MULTISPECIES: oxidoreductase-like domain-containing protein [unclassified Paraburkholderia]